MGNKYKLIKERWIHEFIPKINHDNPYCELFCGSAVMFFNIEAPFAFLNDINKELQNFWKVIRDRYDEFQERIKYYWPGMVVDVKDEIDSAVQFYISNLLSNFITKPMKLDKTIEFWKKKLDSVRLWIDCRPFDEEMKYLMKLFTKNDENRPMSIRFYEDPPYFGSEDVYKSYRKDQNIEKIPKFDHELLAELNHKADQEGHFILLSYNDCPEIRELYTGWYMKSYEYNPNGKNAGRANDRNELIISNFPLQRQGYKKLTFFQNNGGKKNE